MKNVSYLIIALFLLLIGWMNLTPGSFKYAPIDGCACFSSYSTISINLKCEEARKRMCEGPMFFDDFLILLSYLDFYK